MEGFSSVKLDTSRDFASQTRKDVPYTASRVHVYPRSMRFSSPKIMATQLNRKRAYEPPPIPDRLYFKIGDVAELCGVETYVLRFWESQFPQLKPNKSGTGQRLYRRRDVETALEIKRLVHAEGYTLSGARTVLEQALRRPNRSPASACAAQLAARFRANQADRRCRRCHRPNPRRAARARQSPWFPGNAARAAPQPPRAHSRGFRLAVLILIFEQDE